MRYRNSRISTKAHCTMKMVAGITAQRKRAQSRPHVFPLSKHMGTTKHSVAQPLKRQCAHADSGPVGAALETTMYLGRKGRRGRRERRRRRRRRRRGGQCAHSESACDATFLRNTSSGELAAAPERVGGAGSSIGIVLHETGWVARTTTQRDTC